MAASSITSWQIEGGKVESVTDFIFLGSRITVDSDWSHEIKRHLFFRRKATTNRNSVLCAMVFPVVMCDVRVGQ